jgi:hypothetical protein
MHLKCLHQDLEVFVGVLVRVMFANKSDLGWDDSIIRIAPSTYRIRAGNEWYETKQVLSNRAAEYLTGPASRIWLGTVVVDDKEYDDTTEKDKDGTSESASGTNEQNDTGKKTKEAVIKDSWPELHTMSEHQIQELLLSKVPQKFDNVLKERLFTIRSHEKFDIDGKGDNTFDTILHGLDVQTLRRLQIQRPVINEGDDAQSTSQIPFSGSQHRSVNCAPALDMSKRPPQVCHRCHYRMAMEEVGTPVLRIDDLEHALAAYCDAFIGELLFISL